MKKTVPNSEGTQFKKGVSGNPEGRPKKLPELDKLLADVLGKETDGLTQAEVILNKLLQLAKNGDIRASEILLDRAYGKAKQFMQTEDVTQVMITRRTLGKNDKAD